MKRIACKLPLLLLLGAILNVAVAWGFALWINPLDAGVQRAGQKSFLGRDADQWYWFVTTLHRPGSMLVFSAMSGGSWEIPGIQNEANPLDVIPSWTDVSPPVELDGSESSRVFDARGWPALALWCESRFDSPVIRKQKQPVRGGIETEMKPMGGVPMLTVPRSLPMRPIWPGFALNTIFYAAILWLPFAAIGAFRRRRRTKRGLCPMCAYDLRGSQNKLCPECGANASKLS